MAFWPCHAAGQDSMPYMLEMDHLKEIGAKKRFFFGPTRNSVPQYKPFPPVIDWLKKCKSRKSAPNFKISANRHSGIAEGGKKLKLVLNERKSRAKKKIHDGGGN